MKIFAYIEHKSGVADDSAFELAAAARQIDAAAVPTAIVAGSGADVDAVCRSLQGTYAEIWKVSQEALAYPNAELIRQALLQVLPPGCVVLAAHDHLGIDLGPGLAVKLGGVFVPDVMEIKTAGTKLTAVRQEFGGAVSTHVECDIASGAVINVRPGAFKPLPPGATAGTVVDKPAAGTLAAKRRYLGRVAAEAGDVDITKQAVLVSIGRGIQEKDNVPIAEELAEAMGAVVSCSRPVVDAKWMPKSRQVGTSGKTVKPKVYLACGISGAFQHLAGLKGSPFLIAINKNAKAPIFQVADVGIVADLLEFLPVLTNRVREMRAVGAK